MSSPTDEASLGDAARSDPVFGTRLVRWKRSRSGEVLYDLIDAILRDGDTQDVFSWGFVVDKERSGTTKARNLVKVNGFYECKWSGGDSFPA